MRLDRRTLTLLGFALVFAASACGGGGGGGGGGRHHRDAGFRVLEVDPTDGQLAVELDAEVAVTFSSPLALDSIGEENFLVEERASGRTIPGTVTLRSANLIAVFEPGESYIRNTQYRVRIFPDVISIGNENLPEEFVSLFTTEVSSEPPEPPPPPEPSGKIRRVGDMNVGRWNHRATLLGDGTVLVTGGHDTENSLTDSAEIYDPLREEFDELAATLTEARSYHTATRLADGRVLVLGGVTGQNQNETDTAEIYDPSSRSFGRLTARMNNPRAFHTATLLGDGRVLVAGGTVPGPTGAFSSRTAEVFDPANGTFTALPDMAVYRASHSATPLPDGTVLLAGGNGTDRRVEIFDPSTDTFATMAGEMKMPRRGHSADLLDDNTVLLMGGGDRSGELYVIDRDYFRWTPGFPLVDRKDHTHSVLPNGRILFTGGSYYQGNVLFFNNTSEVYDPTSGAFLGNGPLLENPTTRHRATVLDDGTILITGGANLNATKPGHAEAQLYYFEEEDG